MARRRPPFPQQNTRLEEPCVLFKSCRLLRQFDDIAFQGNARHDGSRVTLEFIVALETLFLVVAFDVDDGVADRKRGALAPHLKRHPNTGYFFCVVLLAGFAAALFAGAAGASCCTCSPPCPVPKPPSTVCIL